jgi:hypothetical protein
MAAASMASTSGRASCSRLQQTRSTSMPALARPSLAPSRLVRLSSGAVLVTRTPYRPLTGAAPSSQAPRAGQRAAALPSSQPPSIVRELPSKVAETFYMVQDPQLFQLTYSDALLVRRGCLCGRGFARRRCQTSRGLPAAMRDVQQAWLHVMYGVGATAPAGFRQAHTAAALDEAQPSTRRHVPRSVELTRCRPRRALGRCPCCRVLQTFVDAAILAYECGMNEDSLRYELKMYKASLEQQVAPPGMVSSEAGSVCAQSDWGGCSWLARTAAGLVSRQQQAQGGSSPARLSSGPSAHSPRNAVCWPLLHSCRR